MKQNPSNHNKGEYVLATGSAGSHRLQILHSLYGPAARRLLKRAGLRPGMRVADIGCGVGTMTTLLGELVGPEGEAIGIDFSGAQIAQARELLPEGISNISFIEASATSTGLPYESFDLVYCRYLLLHLPDPVAALREMFSLLKPNGILVCEDGDLTSAGSEPPSTLNAFSDLFGRLGPIHGVDYTLARRLFQMVLDADFTDADICFNQPVVARGETKLLLELSLAEARPTLISAGLVTNEELDKTLSEMRQSAEDETILAVMPRMSQVWARKPALDSLAAA